MKKENLPIFDIHQAAFLDFRGVEPILARRGTRIIFEFPGNQYVFSLLQEYNNNPPVLILDYIKHLRKLRACMLSARSEEK